MNKVIKSILTKIMKIRCKDWVERLPEALWAYRTTWRNTIGFSPYELVYENNVVFPIDFEIKTLRTTIEEYLDLTKAQKNRWNQLNDLDEKRTASIHHMSLIQQQCSKRHD